MRWEGHVAQIVKIKNMYKIVAMKPEGTRSLGGRPRGTVNGKLVGDLGVQ
jgi:hypothetical protein